MSVDLFFNNKEKDTTCYPMYDAYEIPQMFLDITFNQLKNMSNEDFHIFIENIRTWMLDMYDNHNINPFASPKSIDAIIDGFKKFNSMDVGSYYKEYEDNKLLYGSSNRYSNGVNQWFPEIIGTETTSSYPKSFIDALRHKERFHKNMENVILGDALKVFHKLPDNNCFGKIKKVMGVARGVQVVTNFPCHVAKWLYIKYLSEIKDKTLNVYDPCMGWAGRTLSLFSASSHVSLYDKKINFIGTDVNTTTHNRFEKIYRFWDTYISSLKNVKMTKFITPAEDMGNEEFFRKLKGKGHLAFTSPPYYNKERYSDDETQSYIRYKTYPEWRDGFLYGMMKTTHDYLKTDGVFLLNIANTLPRKDGTFKAPMQTDCIDIGNDIGFQYGGKYYLLISAITGSNNLSNRNLITVDGKVWKYEPIHIFIKK